MAPMDAIWLFLLLTYPLPTISWLRSYPIGGLVVLATPVKELSKMVGYTASYLLNS